MSASIRATKHGAAWQAGSSSAASDVINRQLTRLTWLAWLAWLARCHNKGLITQVPILTIDVLGGWLQEPQVIKRLSEPFNSSSSSSSSTVSDVTASSSLGCCRHVMYGFVQYTLKSRSRLPRRNIRGGEGVRGQGFVGMLSTKAAVRHLNVTL